MRLEDMREPAVAVLPDGSHILYISATSEEWDVCKVFFKIVRSAIDLQRGEWQMIPDGVKEEK